MDAPAPACRRSATFYEYLRKQPSRDTLLVNSKDVDDDARKARDGRQGDLPASVPDARIDRHLVRGRRRAGRQGDDLVGDAVGVPDAQHARRCCSACRPTTSASSSRAAPAATASTAPTRCPTTRRCCRRRSASRCACSSRARTRWRGRTTASPFVDRSARRPRRRRHHRRVGLRGVVRVARRPARLRDARATSSPACWPASRRRRSRRDAGAGADGPFNNGSNAAPSYVAGPRRRRRAAAPATSRSERVLVAHRAIAVLHRSAALAGAPAEHVRARMLHGRSRGAREGRSGRVPAAAPERPAAQRGGARRRRRRRTGRRGRRRGPASAQTGVASGRGIACVLLRGRQRLRRDGRRGRRRSGDRRRCTSSGWSSRRTAGPISNPDGMRNQIEGGALQGMSRALGEEVTWDDREGDVGRLADLPTACRSASTCRVIESVLINRHRRRGAAAPARRRSPSSPPRSATRSSTPPARASARCRSRRSASRRRWPRARRDFGARIKTQPPNPVAGRPPPAFPAGTRRRISGTIGCMTTATGVAAPATAGMPTGSPLEETITLRQAKTLISCMAHEQSFLLLSPPGVGKSEMVYQAAAEAGLPCRSLLGTQIAPEDVSGIPRIVGERSVFCPPRILLPETPGAVLPVPRRAAGLRAGRAEGVLLAAARAPARRACAAAGHVGRRGGQPRPGSRAGARAELGADQPRQHPARPRRRAGVARLGRRPTACAPTC